WSRVVRPTSEEYRWHGIWARRWKYAMASRKATWSSSIPRSTWSRAAKSKPSLRPQRRADRSRRSPGAAGGSTRWRQGRRRGRPQSPGRPGRGQQSQSPASDRRGEQIGRAAHLVRQVEVRDGVKEGDVVVLNPPVDLVEGSKVKAQPPTAEASR